jgi:hypothetical protein
MKPVELGSVENTVAEIDCEVIRREGRLLAEHIGLLANVAVDHAQDRGYAEPPT